MPRCKAVRIPVHTAHTPDLFAGIEALPTSGKCRRRRAPAPRFALAEPPGSPNAKKARVWNRAF